MEAGEIYQQLKKLLVSQEKRKKSIKIRKTSTHIKWSYEDEDKWVPIIAISDLQGEIGAVGKEGPRGLQGVLV